MKLLNECVNVFELTDVGVLRRLVLKDGELHEGLGDAVGDDALRWWNWGQDDREQTVGQLVVNLENEEDDMAIFSLITLNDPGIKF